MKTKIVLYNTEKAKPRFEVSQATRPYAILLGISKGNFHLSFPELGQTHIISPYEIAYIPPNTNFYKEVLHPIDFHQFAFEILENDEKIVLPAAGKLCIPKDQVKAIFDSANLISQYHTDTAWITEHILHRILADSHLFSQSLSAKSTSREILAAIDYINAHLHEPLLVSSLAKALHLSHNGLIWKFKHELHITPQKYIAACRLKLAKQLLLEGDMPISQIAEQCGYANAYYFSNAFKQAEGLSPSAFRGNDIS